MLARIAKEQKAQREFAAKKFAVEQKQLLEENWMRHEIEEENKKHGIALEKEISKNRGQGNRVRAFLHRKKLFDERDEAETEMLAHLQRQEREYRRKISQAAAQRTRYVFYL